MEEFRTASPIGPSQTGITSGTGLSPNVAGVLSYVFGLFSGVFFLVLERENAFVRFHALQSILFCAVMVIIDIALGFIPAVGWIVMQIFGLVAFILWLALMWKAYSNQKWELPIIGKIAKERAAQ